jgi:hypothetical protein
MALLRVLRERPRTLSSMALSVGLSLPRGAQNL